jgi:hypothetical protein
MDSKKLLWLGVAVGGMVGAYMPGIWGDADVFGMASIILSALGSLIGLWLGYKASKFIDGE